MRHNVRVAESEQDKLQVKPRKEIQKRSFWRRFFSSFLSLLKEKRPSETKERGDPRRGAVFPLRLLAKVPRGRQRENINGYINGIPPSRLFCNLTGRRR